MRGSSPIGNEKSWLSGAVGEPPTVRQEVVIQEGIAQEAVIQEAVNQQL